MLYFNLWEPPAFKKLHGIGPWPVYCDEKVVMKKSNVFKIAFFSLISFGPIGLISCKEKGPAEKAGENVDEAVEEVKDEVDDATDDQ